MDLIDWLPTIILAFVILFVHFIKAKIDKGVQHGYDKKLESLRTELRKNEEDLKSEIRAKEAKISALQDAVLSGSATRQSLVDKRRIEAVERVWKSVIDLLPLKNISETISVLYDEVKKIAPTNSDIREVFEVMGKGISPEKLNHANSEYERLFINEVAWAYFAAYKAIAYHYYVKLKFLEIGVKDNDEVFSSNSIKSLVKAALPHKSAIIEKHGDKIYYLLFEELENSLLNELRKILKGEAVDIESIERSKKIMTEVEKVTTESAELNALNTPEQHSPKLN